ncbi:alpha-mannosidase [Saccharolobus islandicus]|jgi:alpha-mannosidase|uniref:alpha-mannosidase n=1 Tax=Saccharolobus islandicus TaxID=43080 RepID=UPI00241E903E|nr:alpha-mannosidase [Sulfolobus islandicus]
MNFFIFKNHNFIFIYFYARSIFMRSVNELEARLILILGNSFRNLRQLRWNLENHNKAYLEVEGKGNSYLVIVDHKGSGLIRLNGKPYFELDRYHTLIPIPFGSHKISLELSNYMDFGEKVDISPGIPFYTEIDSNAYRLYIYGSQILDLIRSINDIEVKDDLSNSLSKALREAYFESISKEQLFVLSKLIRTTLDVSRMIQEIDDPLDVYKEDENRGKYERALNVLKSELSRLVGKYGKRGELVGTGHAHIDTAWLWPFDETRRKVLRTFSTILTLLDKYDFHFIQSAAIYYEWIKADSPELFERIKEKVKEGKWELAALYVESDANMVSGESLARQFLYSQRFYLENFGRIANILWLPDTFGFSASLPQIAKLGGVKAFATHKVFWNDTNAFPFNVFQWVGPNGDRLPAVTFGHGKGGYNSDFSASSVLEQYNNWAQKDQPILYSYGYGDGGGGPNEDMLIRAEAINLLPILPKVELSGVNDYIQRIVPVEEWRGELYLETHRGVLTSHSKMKLLNRMAEIALREAELWSTLARTYDKEVFIKLWKVVLKDQFHDVLPGSAIKDVYKVAYQELEDVINRANNIAYEAMQKLVGGNGDKTFVFNSLSWDREEFVEVNGKLVKVKVPSVGFSLLEPLEVRDKVTVSENKDEYLIENKYYRIRVSKIGQLLSIFDKEANREVLKDRGNLLVAYENIPGWADAWDIEKGFEETHFEIKASSSEIVNNDGIVASIKFSYKFRRSEIIQIIRVYADSRRIDFITTLKMKDREVLIKSWFKFDLNVERAVSDIPFGVVERFTWTNTSWDKARFEVPIQKFVDFSESDYGVALLNNGKYGATLRGSSVGLSLTKTPIYPDPSTDLEEITFVYSLYPHVGDWKRAEVVKRAYELNVPLRVVGGISEVKSESFIRVSDKLILEAVKVAEGDSNSIILRLYEYENTRGEAVVELPFNVIEARSLDLLELNEISRDIRTDGNRIKVKYKNRDILTISVRG